MDVKGMIIHVWVAAGSCLLPCGLEVFSAVVIAQHEKSKVVTHWRQCTTRNLGISLGGDVQTPPPAPPRPILPPRVQLTMYATLCDMNLSYCALPSNSHCYVYMLKNQVVSLLCHLATSRDLDLVCPPAFL